MALKRSMTPLLALGLLPLSLALAETADPVQLQVEVTSVDQQRAKHLAQQFRKAVKVSARTGQRAQVVMRHQPEPKVQQPVVSASPRSESHQVKRLHKRISKRMHKRLSKQVQKPVTPAVEPQAKRPDVGQRLMDDASRLMKQTRHRQRQQGEASGSETHHRRQQGERLHELPGTKTGKGGKPTKGMETGQGKGLRNGLKGGSKPGTGFGSGGGKGKAGSGGRRR
jgi:hypothetical protein